MVKPVKNPIFDGLSAEDTKKQIAFNDVSVMHPKLRIVMNDLMTLLSINGEASIIGVVGATGVGKSTMSKKLLGQLAAAVSPELAMDKSAIPLVAVEAYANGETRHSFRPLFEDMRTELQEPGVERKTSIEIKDGYMVVNPGRRQTIPALRRQVDKALKHRKTRIVVIDEAYHMMRFGEDAAVMGTLKSLANKCGATIVLVGSYDLVDMIEGTGQIARRSDILAFERYLADREGDRKEFKKIVKNIIGKWPCSQVPRFEEISHHLMEATFGCVGILKTLLLHASAMQLRNGGVWKTEFLMKSTKSRSLLHRIGMEIEAGEKKIKDAILGESLWNAEDLAKMTQLMNGAAA